jgi:hypothetical protein
MSQDTITVFYKKKVLIDQPLIRTASSTPRIFLKKLNKSWEYPKPFLRFSLDGPKTNVRICKPLGYCCNAFPVCNKTGMASYQMMPEDTECFINLLRTLPLMAIENKETHFKIAPPTVTHLQQAKLALLSKIFG